MDKSIIQTLIDKVIGKKGLIRVPSWWMRKVLMQIADWVQEGDDANSERIEKVKVEADEKIMKVKEGDEKLRNLTLPYMLVSGTGIVNVDGKEVSFTDADKQLIYITGAINFEKQGGSRNDLITYIHIPHIDVRLQGRDMAAMFSYCAGLTSLDLSGFDTSAVTDMASMFSECNQLTSLDLSGFDTSAVTNMAFMFSECNQLTSLDLSGFDTSAVTNMYGMFYRCFRLTSLDFTGFNSSAVTNMGLMFCNCESLISLDLSSFYTSSVENMSSTFNDCRKLTSLDLSGFDTSAVTNMAAMFYNCKSLISLTLGPNFFKTPNVTSIDFSSCTNWTTNTVVTSLVTNSYDRATAGLSTMTLKLSANTKAALTNEQKAAITAKGYTIA